MAACDDIHPPRPPRMRRLRQADPLRPHAGRQDHAARSDETEIFVVAEQTGLLGERELTLIDRVRGHVTHFATCPKAATFRRRKTADEHE